MERLINRRQQGDLGEVSAIEWFTRQGATVFFPLGHSPDVDLVVDFGRGPVRVQVKASTQEVLTPNGHARHPVMLCTNGGNQSWTGRVKRLDASRFDLLFAVTGKGRRWLIPAPEVEAGNCITLGGQKYSEYEIESAAPIDALVYASKDDPIQSNEARGSAGVWRAGPDCKFGALALSEFESHLPHSSTTPPQPKISDAVLHEVGRGTAPRGQTRVSGNRQIVIPKRAFEAAELARGDRLKAFAVGPGEVVFRRVAREQNENGPR